MATAGPRFPGTVATEVGPSGDNDWVNPGNIQNNSATEATITAATYDATDHSYRLKATNFGFDADVPAGSTINGITVEIERRCFAGAAQDQEVRLYDSTGTLVGDDKQTATAWPASIAIATYGGVADTWASGLDDADIRSAGFGVALIVLADGANTDIGVDFIRVTITYTAPAPTATGAIAVPAATVSGTGALVLTATGAVAVPAATVSGAGAEVFTATGALAVPSGTVSGAGAEVFTAIGAVSVPAATVDGTGDHTGGAPPTHEGTGAIAAPSATVSGAGAEILTATGTITIPAAMVAALGSEAFIATGAVTAPAATVDGAGLHAVAVTGTGAITVPAGTVSGTGDDGYNNVIAPMGRPRRIPQAAPIFVGVGSIAVAAARVAGRGSAIDNEDWLLGLDLLMEI